MPFNHLILCRPLLLLLVYQHLGLFPVNQFFISGGQSIGAFSFSVSPPSEYAGLISFRIDWFDILEVQGTFKSLLQHRSSKASILWCSAFFMVQLSHPYMTTEKNIALTRWTFVDKVMFLLFNSCLGWVITFLPGSSVQFSCSVVSDSESQHARPPCPSPTPRVHSDSLSSSQ